MLFNAVLRRLAKAILVPCCLLLCLAFVRVPAFANNTADTNNSTVSLNSSSIPADGSTTATITITAKDSSGNTLSGDTVSLNSTSDSGLVINGGSAGSDTASTSTDSNGVATFTVSSNNANPGTDTFTATDTSDNPNVTLGSSSIAITFTSLTPTPTPASCTDSAPGSTPQLTSANANGSGQITLTWTDATDPVSYYLIAYGQQTGQYIYGNPNVGGQGTTSYTVSDLADGATYYFVVRAANGCNSGSFSNEVSATTTGGVVASTPAPVDTSSQTVGQDTTPSDSPTDIPTDTPMPTDVPVSVSPSPSSTLIAGLFSTKGILGTIASLLLLGCIGGFVYWKKRKNKKINRIDVAEDPEHTQWQEKPPA